MNTPKKYQLKCEGCNKILDLRDFNCLAHGWIEGGEIICYDIEISYLSSHKIGENVQWTKDKKSINLN